MHVVIVPAWMPSSEDPAAGCFILEQAALLQETGRVQVGLIYHDAQEVPVTTKESLHLQGIHHIIKRTPRIPKVNSLLIRLWCGKYLDIFQSYVHQFGQPDIIHAHSYIAGFAAEYISGQTGIPFVLTEHSTNFLNDGIRKYQVKAIKRTLSNAHRIIAVGQSLKGTMEQWTNNQVMHIPNVVNPSTFFYDPQVKKNPAVTMVTIGSLIPRKRVDIIVHALRLCKDVRLVIIGSGPKEGELKRLAEELGVMQSILWIPYLQSADVADTLRRSHMFVSASETETFGIAAAEAMMCGLPVVCTASGGPEEFVRDDQGIVLSNTASARDIAEAIQYVLDNAIAFNPGRISAKTTEQFGDSTIIPVLLQCYEELVQNL